MKLNIAAKIAIGSLLSTLLFIGCVGEQSGGNGGGQQGSTGGKLYISNLGDSTLLTYGNAATANGNQTPTQTIQDLNAQSFILNPSAVFIDPADNLYVANTGLNQILVYQNASAVDGNAVPDRMISGVAPTLSAPRGIALDTTNDVLYVSNRSSNNILVFDNAGTVDGNAAPSRVIDSTAFVNDPNTDPEEILSQPWGVFVDEANDRLYVANTAGNSILVFNSASTLNGSTLPDRTITFSNTNTTLPLPPLSSPSGVFVDTANDILYVASNGNNSILIFDDVDSIDGETTPDRAVSGGQTGLSNPAGIYVDAGILYVANTNNAILVFNNAGTVNGDTAPNRTVSGAATTLSSPAGIFIASDILYTANTADNSIVVFENVSLATGNIAPDRAVSDATTALALPTGIFMDTERNLLYVAKLVNSISVFENASALTNSPPVTRTILPASGTACADSATTREDLCSPRGISMDTANDQLFVANGASSVLVFNQASTAMGNISPDQTLLPASGTACNDSASTKMDLCSPFGVAVNTSNNRLFVANTGANSVLVFSQASTATGNISPDQTLLPASGTACNDSASTKMDLCSPFGVFVDSANDRLYVANTAAGSILVFSGASGLTGAVSPNRTVLPVSGTSCNDSATTKMDLCSPIGIFVDTANDRLYVANAGASSILVFNNAGTINGNAVPDRVIAQGTDPTDNTTLNAPFGLFVDTTR